MAEEHHIFLDLSHVYRPIQRLMWATLEQRKRIEELERIVSQFKDFNPDATRDVTTGEINDWVNRLTEPYPDEDEVEIPSGISEVLRPGFDFEEGGHTNWEYFARGRPGPGSEDE